MRSVWRCRCLFLYIEARENPTHVFQCHLVYLKRILALYLRPYIPEHIHQKCNDSKEIILVPCYVIEIQVTRYLTIIPRARMGSESQPMRPNAKWAIDSEAMRARRIIVLVKSNQLVKNIENKKLFASQSQTLILFCRQKARAFRYQQAQNAAFLIDHQLDFTNLIQLAFLQLKMVSHIFFLGPSANSCLYGPLIKGTLVFAVFAVSVEGLPRRASFSVFSGAFHRVI